MHIIKDERYPDYALVTGETGWIPSVEIPTDTLTAKDIADYHRVEALWNKWQQLLGELYQAAKADE